MESYVFTWTKEMLSSIFGKLFWGLLRNEVLMNVRSQEAVMVLR